jgi:hypothetical protein
VTQNEKSVWKRRQGPVSLSPIRDIYLIDIDGLFFILIMMSLIGDSVVEKHAGKGVSS